jgi:hypothetical protein
MARQRKNNPIHMCAHVNAHRHTQIHILCLSCVLLHETELVRKVGCLHFNGGRCKPANDENSSNLKHPRQRLVETEVGLGGIPPFQSDKGAKCKQNKRTILVLWKYL